MTIFSIIRFNVGLKTFAKLVELLKSSTVTAGLNVFVYGAVWRYV